MTESAGKKRNDLVVWVFFGILVALAGFSLWWAEPVLFRAAGVRAELMEKAKTLRGLPPRRAVAGAGRLVKVYLDAARHVSRARTKIAEASRVKLVLSISLPWTERSEKKWRQRGRSAARLAASLLAQAGRNGVDIRIEIRRRDRAGTRDAAVGWYVYEAAAGRYRWVPKK